MCHSPVPFPRSIGFITLEFVVGAVFFETRVIQFLNGGVTNPSSPSNLENQLFLISVIHPLEELRASYAQYFLLGFLPLAKGFPFQSTKSFRYLALILSTLPSGKVDTYVAEFAGSKYTHHIYVA
jgi:hypothetical protein